MYFDHLHWRTFTQERKEGRKEGRKKRPESSREIIVSLSRKQRCKKHTEKYLPTSLEKVAHNQILPH